MTQTGFQSQRRSQEAAKANLCAQAVIADIRLWASDIANYRSAWGPYNGLISMVDYPEYTITVRSESSGRPLYSPCFEIESQWLPAANPVSASGARIMPNAVVPVEVTVAWSPNILDRIVVLTYIGEPLRDLSAPTFTYGGPTRPSVGVGQTTSYTIAVSDAAGTLDNLFWMWSPDPTYLKATADCPRDGRSYEMVRLTNPGPPDAPPPTPPTQSMVTCYARYAGQYVDAAVQGVELP